MSKLLVYMSMSLDGFVAGPRVSVEHPMGEGGERLHEWLDSPDPRDAEAAARVLSPTTGAVIMGRRTFTVGEGPWGEDGTFGMPCFVVTHQPAETVKKGETTFTFVTGGIDRALDSARAAAAGKDVLLMGASMVQQYVRAGLVDELHITIVPVLLGGGVRLFDGLPPTRIELERTQAVETSTVTHLSFHVVSGRAV